MQKRTTTIGNNHKKGTNRKLVSFQVLSDSAHQAELERYEDHVKLENNYPYHGAHGHLSYDLHDKKWIPQLELITSQIVTKGTEATKKFFF